MALLRITSSNSKWSLHHQVLELHGWQLYRNTMYSIKGLLLCEELGCSWAEEVCQNLSTVRRKEESGLWNYREEEDLGKSLREGRKD